MAEVNDKLLATLIKKLSELTESMEKANVAEYIELFRRPRRLLYLNFLAGIVRGFGIAVGFTAVGAIFLYLLGRVAALNLPVIGHFVAEVARIVELELRHLPR
ncbi:MAG: hypothetical protein GX354_10740 [Firmicutes bacterium]|jgi:hypothetical protein|nr:hypothetical protein [Bacillota bacterium]